MFTVTSSMMGLKCFLKQFIVGEVHSYYEKQKFHSENL